MSLRRSWLIVPAHDAAAIERYPSFTPDVVVLDLEYTVPPKRKEIARSGLAASVKRIADSQGQVFVRIDRETRWADVRAAVARGIGGIVFPGAEQTEDVVDLCEQITAMERERGVGVGSTEVVLMLESAQGFWHIDALAQASPRVSAVGVGRIDLTMQLGPVPQDEFRLYRFLMTRALIAARMLGKQPLGAMWRPGSRGGAADAQHTAKAANEARRMGFTGCVCATTEQVAPVNTAYSIA